jgi:hypothetical protein
LRGADFGHQYGTAALRKKASCSRFGAGKGNFGVKPGLEIMRISKMFHA